MVVRACRFAVAGLVAILSASATAYAQSQQTLQYSPIDRATVRVFALRNVDVVQVSARVGTRWIAVPAGGYGSGVLVSSDGLVLTAAHVVEGARLVAVALPGVERALPARVVYRSAEQDFAFLAIGGEHTSFVELPETPPAMRVREPVAAIGYPMDADRADPQSTSGIIAGILPSGDIQLGIALNPGNSGGPLVNAGEQIIGIVVARGDPRAGVQGIGVAVPLGRVLAARRDHVIARGLLARGREELARAQTAEAPAARAVSMLARLGLAGIGREISELVEARQGELVSLLRDIPADRSNVELSELRAALLWDALAVLLERQSVQTPRDLPPGRRRRRALRWEREAVALCQTAARIDPELPRRSPFVAFILSFWPVGRAATSPPTERVAPAQARARPGDDSPSRWGGYVLVSIPNAPSEPIFDPAGVLGGGGLTFLIAQANEQISPALIAGSELLVGSWDDNATALFVPWVSLRLAFADRSWMSAAWTPTIIVREGETISGSLAATRLSAGIRIGPVAFAGSVRLVVRDGPPGYYALELSIGYGY